MRKTSERDWASYLESAMRGARLSQAELSRRSGVAESMVSRWLRGLNQPDVPNLRRVRPVLGVRMLELLVAAGHLTTEEAQLRDVPEPPTAGVPDLLDGLTGEQVRQVEDYAAFLRTQNARDRRVAEQLVRDEDEGRLRYAAYGGAKLTREQEERARDQARRARERAGRTGQRVVYLDGSDDPEH